LTERLVEFATADFTLSVKQDDGHTLRDHLVNAWKQSGIMPDELRTAPRLPELTGHLWGYYLRLHRRRQNYGWGHVPLTYLEVEAWARLNKVTLDHWELDAILEIDDAYLASTVKSSKGS